MSSVETIIICDPCKGSGKKVRSERYDHHHKYDWVWDEVCFECGGHGRVREVVETTLYKLTEDDLKLTPKPIEAE
jgi:DnaJ-class molecular chaperone